MTLVKAALPPVGVSRYGGIFMSIIFPSLFSFCTNLAFCKSENKMKCGSRAIMRNYSGYKYGAGYYRDIWCVIGLPQYLDSNDYPECREAVEEGLTIVE